jgi:hypothetical protein
MSVVLPASVPYFQLPQAFVADGFIWRLPASAKDLYTFLHWKAQRFSSSTVRVKNEELGLNPATERRARAALLREGLVNASRGTGGVYEYTICDPKTKEPLRKPHEPLRFPHAKHKKAGARSECLKQTRRGGDLRQLIDGLTPEAKLRFYEARVSPQRRVPDGYWARCPFHDDTEASLHITRDGLWYCHGCKGGGGLIDFEQELSRTTRETAARVIVQECAPNALVDTKYEAVYSYTDENGSVLSQVFRYPGKKFKQGYVNADGKRVWNTHGIPNVPYRLHQLIAAKDVFVVEGEKDADRLSALVSDFQPPTSATTCRNGAGSWPLEFGNYFQGKYVVVLPDNDDAGLRHARAVVESVKPYAAAVKTVLLPELKHGGDVSDYLDAHSFDEFVSEVLKVEWETSR